MAPATAEALIARGAPMAFRHAAGLGRVEALADSPPPDALEEALAYACIRGQEAAVAALLRHGATGDVLIAPGGRTPRTALHEAANRGHRAIVELLLDNGADPGVIEPRWDATPAGWAEHDGHYEVAALLRRQVRYG